MPNSEHKRKTVSVPDGIEPIRIDKYLASLPALDLSRAFIQQMISDDLIVVDGVTVSKNHKLKGGEEIILHIPPPETPDLTPQDIPLDIAYEDDHLAVVNKPAGLVVHPAPGNPSHTLVNALLHHFGQLSSDDSPDGLRPGIIHRLDKNTSGLLLVAKNDRTARRLRQQLADREIVKIYTAVVCGHMPDEAGTINLPIGRSIRDQKKMTVTNVKSREAITEYTVRERYRINDLIGIKLVTGRTHQIRVHFAHLNRPVLGDPDYGGRHKWLRGIMPENRRIGSTVLKLIDRQALHATSLEFVHPVTNEQLKIESELPDDIARVLEHLRSQTT